MNQPTTASPLDASQKQIELAAALARERVLDTHVAHVLELLERGRGEVSPPRLIEIYLRLHPLPQDDSRIVTHRVLVALGHQTLSGDAERADENQPAQPEAPWEDPLSLPGRLRKRLRGRTNKELRRWVELQTGRAEVALLDVHIENVLRFVEILKPEESYAGVVTRYVEMLRVSEPWSEVLYFFALARLSPSSAVSIEEASLSEATQPTVFPGENKLRLIEGTG